MAYYRRAFPEVWGFAWFYPSSRLFNPKHCGSGAKSDYNAGSAILNISGDRGTLGFGVGAGLLERKAKVLISNEAKSNDSNGAG
ncbi:MAG: hypothetical protein DMG96_01460 [Acidobacteria bacterium]|nr:MAG: hypothetical protein DMG96_01460 [Acidobacteriota bacterium]